MSIHSDHVFDGVEELPQLFPQARRGISDTHPSPPPDLLLEPVLEHTGHAHQVHVHPAGAVAVDVAVAAERLPRQNAQNASLFLGFTDRRLSWPLAVIDEPLR